MSGKPQTQISSDGHRIAQNYVRGCKTRVLSGTAHGQIKMPGFKGKLLEEGKKALSRKQEARNQFKKKKSPSMSEGEKARTDGRFGEMVKRTFKRSNLPQNLGQ